MDTNAPHTRNYPLAPENEQRDLDHEVRGFSLNVDSELVSVMNACTNTRGQALSIARGWMGDGTNVVILDRDGVTIWSVNIGEGTESKTIGFCMVTPLAVSLYEAETLIREGLDETWERRQKQVDDILALLNAPIGSLKSDHA